MNRTVLVIGGGLAGLTAALRLSALGYAVTILERHGELGGRLLDPGPIQEELSPVRRGFADALPLVLLGCQTATRSLLTTLGMAEAASFSSGLRFEFFLPGHRTVRLPRLWAPAPHHAVLSLAAFRGLPLQDRWRLITWLERTWEADPAPPADLETLTADDWLAAVGQSESARASVWNPLARFLVGEDLTVVSAAILASTLMRCFLASWRDSRIALPTLGIRELLIAPAVARLTGAGATIRFHTAVTQMRFDTRQVTGIQLAGGETLTADWYIVALPHRALNPLLPERVLTHFSYFHQLTKLTDSPALTVHLRLDRRLPSPRLVLLAERTFHWMLCRTEPGHDGRVLVSLVSTGNPKLLERSDCELIEAARADAGLVTSELCTAAVLDHRIIRQPRAFLSVRPGTCVLRPLQQSPFANLLLAGDWTDTGLPATLESAILSGDRCAEHILAASTGVR